MVHAMSAHNKHVNAKSANQENSILSNLRKSITDDRSVRVYIQVQLLVRIMQRPSGSFDPICVTKTNATSTFTLSGFSIVISV